MNVGEIIAIDDEEDDDLHVFLNKYDLKTKYVFCMLVLILVLTLILVQKRDISAIYLRMNFFVLSLQKSHNHRLSLFPQN